MRNSTIADIGDINGIGVIRDMHDIDDPVDLSGKVCVYNINDIKQS